MRRCLLLMHSPAKVLTVILDEENKTARTVVFDDRYLLSVGRAKPDLRHV